MIDPALHEEAPHVDARMLRQFAGLLARGLPALAYWRYSAGHPTTALVLGGLAAALGPLGLIGPRRFDPSSGC